MSEKIEDQSSRSGPDVANRLGGRCRCRYRGGAFDMTDQPEQRCGTCGSDDPEFAILAGGWKVPNRGPARLFCTDKFHRLKPALYCSECGERREPDERDYVCRKGGKSVLRSDVLPSADEVRGILASPEPSPASEGARWTIHACPRCGGDGYVVEPSLCDCPGEPVDRVDIEVVPASERAEALSQLRKVEQERDEWEETARAESDMVEQQRTRARAAEQEVERRDQALDAVVSAILSCVGETSAPVVLDRIIGALSGLLPPERLSAALSDPEENTDAR